MENEKEIRSARRKLKILKDEFSDVIPKEPVYSASKNNRYKCRKAWWGGLRDNFDILEENMTLPEEIINNYHSVFQKYLAVVDQDEYGIKPENIKEANELISQILNTLESRLASN